MGFLSNAKDRMVETMALQYANASLLAPYGRATQLQLDSGAKNIRVELELKGEAAPIHIEIRDYQLTAEGGRYFASAREIVTSREWLTRLAADRFANQRIELPQNVGSLVSKYL